MVRKILAFVLLAGALSAAPEPLQRDTQTKALIQTELDLKSVTLTLGSLVVSDSAGIRVFDLGSTNGTRIGDTGDKIGFLGATPIVRPSSTTDLRQSLINLGLYTTGGASPLNLNGGAFTSGTISGSSFLFSGNGAVGGTLSAASYYIGADLILTHPLTPSPDNDARTNISLGYAALTSIAPISSTQYNTAIGFQSMNSLTTGDHNTAIGAWSLSSATTASQNTAIGLDAMRNFTTGGQNVAIGEHAQTQATTASANTSVGVNAMGNAGGEFNSALGYFALFGNTVGPPLAGDYNTAMGCYSLAQATGTSQHNTAVGCYAGYGLTTGYSNTYLGEGAGSIYPITGSDNILIGTPANVVNAPTAGSSFTLNIGNLIKGTDLNDAPNSAINFLASQNYFEHKVAVNGAAGGFPLSVRTGTNHNLVIEDVTGASRIRVINDAQTANMPLEIFSPSTTISGPLTVSGGILHTPVAPISSATYTMVADSPIVHFNGGSGIAVTLLSPATYPGMVVNLHTYSSIAITSASSNVIDLLGNVTNVILPATAGKWTRMQSDGTYWRMSAGN